jgi:hypothetical protein
MAAPWVRSGSVTSHVGIKNERSRLVRRMANDHEGECCSRRIAENRRHSCTGNTIVVEKNRKYSESQWITDDLRRLSD